MIRIDEIRLLHRDLHMRPFEADRRVYLLFSADLMNDDATAALLKDLEEPPPYAVIVLVADNLGPIAETIRSRCQLVPFRRLSERAVRDRSRRAPELDERAAHRARTGRRGEARSTGAAARRRRRRAPRDADRAGACRLRRRLRARRRRAGADRERAPGRREGEGLEEVKVQGLELPTREADQRVKRAQRGAEREELLAQLEELAAWYRDLVVVAVGADRAAVHVDRLDDLRIDATRERMLGAERAAEAVRETWRQLEEFNLAPQLALESLFVRLERELAA